MYGACKNARKFLHLQENPLPVRFYLDKRLNKYGEAPIRLVWSFNGDRYQTTLGITIPPVAWNKDDCVVTPEAYNHKQTPTLRINGFISSLRDAVNWIERYAALHNFVLNKEIVRQVVGDVIDNDGNYPYERVDGWKIMLHDNDFRWKYLRDRCFKYYKGGTFRILEIGVEPETFKEFVVYRAAHSRSNQVWVLPFEKFFGKVSLPDGTEVNRFIEITD